MKGIKEKIMESKSSIDEEIEQWEQRLKEPFGQALKELQFIINDSGLYAATKNEYGFYVFTPFDHYVTAYALDGNKQYTYKHVKAICDDYDFVVDNKVRKILNKLEKLSK